jgi:hypothetical protein
MRQRWRNILDWRDGEDMTTKWYVGPWTDSRAEKDESFLAHLVQFEYGLLISS